MSNGKYELFILFGFIYRPHCKISLQCIFSQLADHIILSCFVALFFFFFSCFFVFLFSCFLVFGHLATSDSGDRHVYVCVHAVRVPQPHRVRLRQRHDGGHQVKII